MLPSNVSDFEATHGPGGQGPVRRRSGRGRVIAGIVITLLLLVGLAGVAVGRFASGALSTPARPTASAARTAPQRGAPADAATQQAIQTVITQVDQAQAQALATNDPTVMRDMATPQFYDEQVRTNSDLAANGVTEIKLVNLEWGPITVDGSTATASVYETWTTTFDDGTSEQSRDRNVYTLVQDNNGAWKVEADDHPDAQQAATPQSQPNP